MQIVEVLAIPRAEQKTSQSDFERNRQSSSKKLKQCSRTIRIKRKFTDFRHYPVISKNCSSYTNGNIVPLILIGINPYNKTSASRQLNGPIFPFFKYIYHIFNRIWPIFRFYPNLTSK